MASLLESSSHLINGPTNTISLVHFSALAPFEHNCNVSEVLFILGIIVGSIQIISAVLKHGDLTRYVSESVIPGLAGEGFLIVLADVGVTHRFAQSQIFPEEAETFRATPRAVRHGLELARSSRNR